jgi:hypothetical protein
MTATPNTVHGRIERARAELTPVQMAAVLLLAAALGFTLLFVQEPLVHDSLHNFRHAAGITCH